MLFLDLRRFSDDALELAETDVLDEGGDSTNRFGFIGIKSSLHPPIRSVYSHKDMNEGNDSRSHVDVI